MQQARRLHAVARERLAHGEHCGARPEEALDLDGLVLEHLVVLEEALELAREVARKLRDVAELRIGRIIDMDGDDLVVGHPIIEHAHQADGARAHHGERYHRLVAEHQHVERIAVLAVGARHESVVRRVDDRAVEDAIDAQEAALLVELVFHARATRDLDHDVEPLVRGVRVDLEVVPWMGRHRATSRGFLLCGARGIGLSPPRSFPPRSFPPSVVPPSE